MMHPPSALHTGSPIDIIIPCFRGIAETRRTIESVLAATVATPHHIIVINDAAPEPELSDYLSSLPPQVELIRHQVNRGFVASVNEGMQLNLDRDVLLLNSDTAVAAGWLDRISAHAGVNERVASVTPFSNNASIASHPRIAESNAMDVDDLAAIDTLAARVNRGRSVEAPVGVGFCMWISRAALNEVGCFDEAQFGKGYGEEVEWCLRASQRGYKHLIATDVLVFHAGEVSFGSGAPANRERAQALIDQAFPSYPGDVQSFIARDPAYEFRRRLMLAAEFAGVGHRAKPTVLHINTLNGGGVDRFIRDIGAGVSSVRHVTLHVGQRCLLVESVGEGYIIQLEDVSKQAACLLKALRVSVLHVHSTSAEVWAVVSALRHAAPGLRYLLTLHDVLFVNDHAFDKEAITPDDGTLRRTTRMAADAVAVTAPSEFVAGLARQHLRIEPLLLPNAIPCASRCDERPGEHAGTVPKDFSVRVANNPVIAVVGAIGPHKGSNVLASILDHLPTDVFCVIVGYTDTRTAPGWITDRVYVHGPYLSHELPFLLKMYGARIALFPNRAPESFSYVLSEVWKAGLPALVPSVGALAERVRRWGGGEIFDHNAAPAEIAMRIETMVRSPPANPPPNSPPAIPDFAHMTLTLDRLYEKHADEHRWALSADESVAAVEQFVKINLDGTEFRKELIRLIATNAALRTSLAEHQSWQAHLERDIATSKEDLIKTQSALAAQRDWCGKLERDVAVLEARVTEDAKRYRVVRAAFDRLPQFIQRTVIRWGSGAR
jgi:O-antigen biosynthesis protein